mgnify:CR=1 FL=1
MIDHNGDEIPKGDLVAQPFFVRFAFIDLTAQRAWERMQGVLQ